MWVYELFSGLPHIHQEQSIGDRYDSKYKCVNPDKHKNQPQITKMQKEDKEKSSFF